MFKIWCDRGVNLLCSTCLVLLATQSGTEKRLLSETKHCVTSHTWEWLTCGISAREIRHPYFVCNNNCFLSTGADITDYFNYGFTEDTWKQYCEKQRRMRMELQMPKKIFVSCDLLLVVAVIIRPPFGPMKLFIAPSECSRTDSPL